MKPKNCRHTEFVIMTRKSDLMDYRVCQKCGSVKLKDEDWKFIEPDIPFSKSALPIRIMTLVELCTHFDQVFGNLLILLETDSNIRLAALESDYPKMMEVGHNLGFKQPKNSEDYIALAVIFFVAAHVERKREAT
jgi:hypothetical protein